MASNHGGLHSLHDPHAYSNSSLPHPPQSQAVHNAPQRTLHHARSHPHLQHTTLSDSASAYELYGSHPGAPNQSGGGTGGGGGGNYTHVRDVSNGSQYAQGMDPRQNGVNGGYQTPMHSGNNGGGGSQAGSLHNTPHAHQQQQQQQHLPMYGNDEQYAGR